MLQGKVYLVGVDPSDVELTTLKDYQLICQANLILYDHLIPAPFTVSGLFYFYRTQARRPQQDNRNGSEVQVLALLTLLYMPHSLYF